MTTAEQYDRVLQACRQIYQLKMKDYGTSWRLLRPSSLTDQLYIKAKRLRTVEKLGAAKVEESPQEAFRAIVNYAVMALIQLELVEDHAVDLPTEEALSLYDGQAASCKKTMLAKNHDYGEAWREMRISSFVDLILTKLHRIKQIEENEGETVVSEGLSGHYTDILNYAVFALIKLDEANDSQ